VAELQRITAQRPALTPAARSPETTQRALLDRREAEVLPLRRMIAARALQPKLTVGAADDPFEREAEHTADTVMAAESAPKAAEDRIARTGIAASLMRVVMRALGKTDPPTRKDDDEKKKLVQKESAGAGPSLVPAGIESSIETMSAGGGGAPLPSSLRAQFEPRFGYDFGSVRMHTGNEAAGAATALGARAFTIGDHVFFGAGEYRPASASAQHLIAHELTHTIQQKPAAARASRLVAPKAAAPRRVQRVLEGVKEKIRNKVREFIVRDFPPWDLITLIIGYDPIQEKSVKGATRDWIHAAMKLAPDGEALFDRLDKEGKIDSVAKWWDTRIAALDVTYASMVALVKQAWDLVGAGDVFDPVGAWNKKLKPLFEPVVKRVWDFIKDVGAKVLAVVKDLVLNQLGEWAKKQKGYPLLTMILGKDPVTGEEVKPTLKGVIYAVLDLIDGGDKIKENLEKAKTVEKAAAWFKDEVKKLDLTWEGIKALFKAAWDAFKISDLLTPKILFEKMAAIFGPPVLRLLKFLLAVAKKILEFIFEGAMLIAGPIGVQIVGIVKKIGDTFNKIVDDPVAFIGHLVDAVKKGISQFAKNILDHLKTGLIEWLVGTLDGAGIVLPKVWDLKGILDLVLQILGITYAKIRVKLVKVLGEKTVSMLEKAFVFIKTLVTEGPVAAWKQIVDAIGGLWDMVIGGIKDWAITKIVTAAIMKLVTMFNPAGAIIQAIIATYNTVAFFIERIKQILAFVEAVVDSIANVANGKIDAAANWIEKAMARSIPVLLGFLARLIGLGNVSDAVKKVITAIQAKVDKGIDFVIDWVVKQAKALFGGKSDDKDDKKDQDPKWGIGVAGVHTEIGEMEKNGPVTTKELDAAIPAWKSKYEFKSLRVDSVESKWTLVGSMSPERVVEEHKVETPAALKDLLPEVDYYFPMATAKGKNGDVVYVGEFVELKMLNGEWWVAYLPSKRKRGSSGATKVMTRAMKAGTTEKAYVRAGTPGTITPTLSQGTGPGGRAMWVHAQPLALQGSYTAPGTTSPLGWARLGSSANWVRAHLINGEMGGPAATWNLVPAPTAVNNAMTRDHENPIRRDLEKGKYFFFGADVDYYSDADSKDFGRASDFARHISVSYGETDLVPPDLKVFKDSAGALKSKSYSVPLPALADLDPKRRAA
jgi:hypothetical protein